LEPQMLPIEGGTVRELVMAAMMEGLQYVTTERKRRRSGEETRPKSTPVWL
jgi:hypothetical protein